MGTTQLLWFFFPSKTVNANKKEQKFNHLIIARIVEL